MKIVIKMLVDVTMMALFLLLMFGYKLSPLFHEIAGIAIGVVFMVHILLNLKATQGILGSLASGRLKGATKFNAILDVMLLVMMPLDIISGLLDSKFILYSPYNSLISTVHHVFSWIVFAIIAGHLYLHLNYLKATIKSKFMRGKQSKGNALALMGLLTVVGGLFLNSFLLVLNINNDSDMESNVSDLDDDDSASSTEDDQIADSSSGATDDDQSTTDGGGTTDKTITLSEYLKGLNCDGCGRRCSLANPRCGIGENQAEQATLDYERLYGQIDSSNTSLVAATISSRE